MWLFRRRRRRREELRQLSRKVLSMVASNAGGADVKRGMREADGAVLNAVGGIGPSA
jgi:hypothetical protein